MDNFNPALKARMKLQELFETQGECTHCGRCCTQSAPIEVNIQDIKNMAEFFDKDEKIIFRRHCKLFPGDKTKTRFVMKRDKPCKFWREGKGCKIYPVRPLACKYYPFLIGEWDTLQFPIPECPGARKVYLEFKEMARKKGKLKEPVIKDMGKVNVKEEK